ncbi:MAG TPA: hypothetical protein VGL71_02625, partial [Urbifossiella sp.]
SHETLVQKLKRIMPQPASSELLPDGEEERFEEYIPGPPIYHMRMPPAKGRVRRLPGGHMVYEKIPPEEQKTQEEMGFCLFDDRPLIPSAEELAKLPKNARMAFLQRCAARVCKLRAANQACPTEIEPAAAAALILAAATVEMPVHMQLRSIRRDFDRIRYKVYKHKWTDETPIPPDAFGRMWPKTLEPSWAKEPTEVGP